MTAKTSPLATESCKSSQRVCKAVTRAATSSDVWGARSSHHRTANEHRRRADAARTGQDGSQRSADRPRRPQHLDHCQLGCASRPGDARRARASRYCPVSIEGRWPQSRDGSRSCDRQHCAVLRPTSFAGVLDASGGRGGPDRCGDRARQSGWATMRVRFDRLPSVRNLARASSSVNAGMMRRPHPGFQLTGRGAWCLAVSCSESITRRISLKLRPVSVGRITA